MFCETFHMLMLKYYFYYHVVTVLYGTSRIFVRIKVRIIANFTYPQVLRIFMHLYNKCRTISLDHVQWRAFQCDFTFDNWQHNKLSVERLVNLYNIFSTSTLREVIDFVNTCITWLQRYQNIKTSFIYHKLILND